MHWGDHGYGTGTCSLQKKFTIDKNWCDCIAELLWPIGVKIPVLIVQ
jgi:hypothetical protein